MRIRWGCSDAMSTLGKLRELDKKYWPMLSFECRK